MGVHLSIHLFSDYLLSISCVQHTVKNVTGYRVEYDIRFMFLKDLSGSVVSHGIQDEETKAGQQARKLSSIQGEDADLRQGQWDGTEGVD